MGFAIPILSDLVSLGKTWIQGKQKQSQAKADAKAKVMITAAESTADWVTLMAKASATSWKDEFVLVIISIPIMLCFVPGMAPYVAQGFQALDANTPGWFQNLLYVAYAGSFGVKAGQITSSHRLTKKALDAK